MILNQIIYYILLYIIFYSILYIIILYIILYNFILYCIILYYFILFYIVLYYIIFYYILYYITLYYIILYYIIYYISNPSYRLQRFWRKLLYRVCKNRHKQIWLLQPPLHSNSILPHEIWCCQPSETTGIHGRARLTFNRSRWISGSFFETG